MDIRIAIILALTLSGGFYNYTVNLKSSGNILHKEISYRPDSVIIEYWGNIKPNEYKIKYHDGSLHVRGIYNDYSVDLKDNNIIDKFAYYADMFFISKTEKIVLSKTKRDNIVVSDYARLQITIYAENQKALDESIILGDDEYDIEYNPKFLEFYDFIYQLTD